MKMHYHPTAARVPRARHGQRTKQRGVDEAEDRRVDTDAERNREHRDERKPFASRQHTYPVAHVLPHVFSFFLLFVPLLETKRNQRVNFRRAARGDVAGKEGDYREK
jgi:hypothetical protein